MFGKIFFSIFIVESILQLKKRLLFLNLDAVYAVFDNNTINFIFSKSMMQAFQSQ